MKKLLMFLLNVFLISCTPKNAKIETDNTDLNDKLRNILVENTNDTIVSEPSICLVFENRFNNELFMFYDNLLSIKSGYYDIDKLKIELTNGTLTKIEKGKYIARIDSAKPTFLKIYTKNSKLIYSKHYWLHHYPLPFPQICEKKNGKIQKSELTENKKVDAFSEYFGINKEFIVTKFRIICYINGVCNIEYSESNLITKKQAEIITQLNLGDYLYFDEIFIDYEGSSEKISSMYFEIL